MTDVALEREAGVLDESAESIKAKKWDEALEKPALDYSEFFDSDVGSFPGLSIWEIENFYPNQVNMVRKLMYRNQRLWKIRFWSTKIIRDLGN